jgi:hypothetical protein
MAKHAKRLLNESHSWCKHSFFCFN